MLKVASRKINTKHNEGKRISFKTRINVRDTVTKIDNNIHSIFNDKQGQVGSNGNIENKDGKNVKKKLGHLLAAGLNIERSFCQNRRGAFGDSHRALKKL